MLKRSVSVAVVLALLSFAPLGCSSSDTAAGSGQTSGGKSSGSGNASGQGTPGCQPTLQCAGFCQDQACVDACLAKTTDGGAQRFQAFSDCGAAASCMDVNCSIAACPGEYDACVSDLGDGGTVCLAEGVYLACDGGGNCSEKVATGGAWGPDDAQAHAGALQNCTDQMLALIAIEQVGGGAAEVGLSCYTYQCSPNE